MSAFLLFAVAQVTSVSNSAELTRAIARAKGGDVIELAPGDYGVVGINKAQFDAPVTIRSADPNRPAVFSRITLNQGRNVRFSDIEVAYVPAPGEGNGQKMFRINGGSNITLDKLYVHGVIDGDVRRDANGIAAVGVEGFTVSNSRIVHINAGIAVNGGRNVRLTANEISFIGSDAIEIPGGDGVLIEGNKVRDFRTNPGLHPDFVQCWTTRQKSGCKNVRILRNEIRNTPGHESQGVFFGDEDKVGGYENIEISDNLFSMTWWHAISITGAPKNVVIRRNRVVAGPNYPRPWIRVGGPAIVEGNIAPAYLIGTKKSIVPRGNSVGGAFRR